MALFLFFFSSVGAFVWVGSDVVGLVPTVGLRVLIFAIVGLCVLSVMLSPRFLLDEVGSLRAVGSDVDPCSEVGSMREVGLGVESLPPLAPFLFFLSSEGFLVGFKVRLNSSVGLKVLTKPLDGVGFLVSVKSLPLRTRLSSVGFFVGL